MIKWMEFCMSDNIRNKTIFETKIAKIAKKTTKISHFEKITPTLHNGDVFANTTKNSGDSRMYSYWDLAWTKHTFKKWFFLAKTSKMFSQNWILIFCCTTSVGMLFLEFFAIFLHERFLEIWLGQESVTDKRADGRTDGRTHIHGGKNNICLPQGETYNNNNKSRCKEMERSMITRTSFWNKK